MRKPAAATHSVGATPALVSAINSCTKKWLQLSGTTRPDCKTSPPPSTHLAGLRPIRDCRRHARTRPGRAGANVFERGGDT